jgi:hypothetical protein
MKYLSHIAKNPIRLVITLIFFALFINVKLNANPLPKPPTEFAVSEFMFDSEGKWMIELGGFYHTTFFSNGKWMTKTVKYFDFSFREIDSICITTSSGKVKVNNLPYGSDEFISETILLSNNDLDSDLIIKQTGDYIKITTYYNQPQWYNGSEIVDSLSTVLVFGDYEGATVRSPGENESIVWTNGDLYSINKTPTIGQLNKDESGTYSAVKFNIFYPDKQPFTATYAKLCDNNDKFEIDLVRQEKGSYSGEVHYCLYHIDKMYFKVYKTGIYRDYWTIFPFNISDHWDTSSSIDVYLNQFVDIKPIPKEDAVFKIFPNPIIEKSFYYETALPVNSTNCIIEITGLNGQKIGSYPISESKGKIALSSNILQGIYTVRLIVNNKNYANTKIIVP